MEILVVSMWKIICVLTCCFSLFRDNLHLLSALSLWPTKFCISVQRIDPIMQNLVC